MALGPTRTPDPYGASLQRFNGFQSREFVTTLVTRSLVVNYSNLYRIERATATIGLVLRWKVPAGLDQLIGAIGAGDAEGI